MTKEQYIAAAAKIKQQAADKQKALDLKYAISNSRFEPGCIIRDTVKGIIIDEVRPTFNFLLRMPECEFVGREIYLTTFEVKRKSPINTIKQSYITHYLDGDQTWQIV